MSGRIVLAQEWIEKLLFDKECTPRFGLDFPARRINTSMVWDDVMLHPQTFQQVNDLSIWLKHHGQMAQDENLSRKVIGETEKNLEGVLHDASINLMLTQANLLDGIRKEFLKEEKSI